MHIAYSHGPTYRTICAMLTVMADSVEALAVVYMKLPIELSDSSCQSDIWGTKSLLPRNTRITNQ